MSTLVGFVGLGNMGLPMAQNLLKTGYALHVFNRTAARADALLAQGATWAPSPREVAARTGLVLSMVTDDEALNAVTLGDQGIIAGLPPDGVHVDMSTVYHGTSRRLANLYRERGTHFIASPVSGRPDHAAAAQLLIYAGGSAEALERCRPVLETLGRGVIAVGDDPHLANVLKLVTNLIVFAIDETLSEAFTLADKAGLQREPVLEMIRVFFPAPIIQVYAKRIATSDFYSPGANVHIGLKDLGLMRRLAEQIAAPLPMAELASRHLLAALARGRGDLDVAALVTVVRELAGLPPGTR